MEKHQQDIANLLVPYLANPGLVFGGSHRARKVVEAQAIADALDNNPDLPLGDIQVEDQSLIECFMNEVWRLQNFCGPEFPKNRAEASDQISKIGIALIDRHGCNPWAGGIPVTMNRINLITLMEDPPLTFVKAVMGHPMAPSPANIEQALVDFDDSAYERKSEQGPVHYACNQNRGDLVGFWLGLGFGVQARDREGKLPIAIAASPEVAKVLLDAGSAITGVNSRGEGVMDAWSRTVSASAKEAMGKEVSRAIDQGKVPVDRNLLVEMVRNDTAKRKIEEMMKSSGIGWWDAHEEGSIARLAIVDMLARYNSEPQFVRGRITSLVTSAYDWAMRERVAFDGFDREMMAVAGEMMGIEKIDIKRTGDEDISTQLFLKVLNRFRGNCAGVITLAAKWEGSRWLPDASAVDLLCFLMPGYRKGAQEACRYASPISSEFPAQAESAGRFVHKILPDMIKRLDLAQQGRVVPAMAIMSSDLFARSSSSTNFGMPNRVPGGIQEALLSLDIATLAGHIDAKAVGEAVEFIGKHKKVYSMDSERMDAFLSSVTMFSVVPEPRQDVSQARKPRL